MLDGAPGTIRTSDPQIRSLVLYPAELRARFSLGISGHQGPIVPRAFGIHCLQVAKARHCYRLRPCLASSVKAASLRFTLARCASRFPKARASENAKIACDISRFERLRRAPASAAILTAARTLSSRPLVADAQEFHRPVRYRDPERRADGSFHHMDLTAMGTHEFGGDGK